MKKNRSIFCILLCGLALLTGCEKELMSYEGKDCLYFDVRIGTPALRNPNTWGHEYFTAVDFGNLSIEKSTLSLKVMASGLPRDYDRPFTVTINADSTTAIVGSDFDNFKENYVIKAGETSAQVTFIAYRTAKMDGDTLQIQLQLHQNEFFELNYTNYGDYPNRYTPFENKKFDYNKNANIHNIFLYDVLSKPDIWSGLDNGYGLFGKFSATKFKLIMAMTNTTTLDFKKESTTMPSARRQAISEQISGYLLERARAKDPVLDEDGTMMYFSYVTDLGGSQAWKPFTKPEDYYK